MKKITINNFGPIKKCDIEIKDFNVITGKQSSGKSTIAKSLYLFFLLKDELAKLVLDPQQSNILIPANNKLLFERFLMKIKMLFNEIFGYDSSMLKNDTFICMEYSPNVYIHIRNNRGLSINCCNSLEIFITSLENKNPDVNKIENREAIKKEIEAFFDMDFSVVYIPAGRSVVTTIGNQFSLFYSRLEDPNKRMIDRCTRDYFEMIMQLKPLFNKGLSGLIGNGYGYGYNEKVIDLVKPYYCGVINGEYQYANGKEVLVLSNGTMVEINFASSGQQEALWIYNILLYYSIVSEKKFFIIEEPESNLFPESQMLITKFIAFIANQGAHILINTHSPYVLGEINNLIYAGSFETEKREKVSDIVGPDCNMRFKDVTAVFIEEDKVSDCMDLEIEQIDNSRLDAISVVINKEYDQLLEVEKE